MLQAVSKLSVDGRIRVRRSMYSHYKTHVCDYEGCQKSFHFRQDLLRHQTKKHGRKAAIRSRPCTLIAPNTCSYSSFDGAVVPIVSGAANDSDPVDPKHRRQLNDMNMKSGHHTSSYLRAAAEPVVGEATADHNKHSGHNEQSNDIN